ncbi:MAG: M20/M25/M40 family metallo-hydrolase [Actinobacteria bacterium]|nr:M20/M25/M40 family metallo-hydrolase [Actinomycetota bacterium]
MAGVTLGDETASLLQRLIRLNTVSPPGNETEAARLLQAYLAQSGVEARLVAKDEGRANLVARLPGAGGPSLLLVGHTDTVRAEPEDWTRDPWSGDLVGGEVWGRGALDMKGHVAAAAVAFASLAREGFRPAGDIVLALTADEEVGDDLGLSWLAREHGELVRSDFALNEGGGDRCVFGGRTFYLCGLAEKTIAPLRLRVTGRAGHASMPALSDNALVKAGPLIEAIARLEPPRTLLPEVERFLLEILGEVPPVEVALERARALHPLAALIVEPVLAATLSPTMIEASRQLNVVPGSCEVVVDCRLLPGQAPADLEPLLRAALGKGDWDLEWLDRLRVGGSGSPLDTELWHALQSWVDLVEPGARLVPTVCSGFTDSHYLRMSLDTVAYGFFPLRAMDPELAAQLVHGADERIAVADLADGVDVFRHVSQVLGESALTPA